MGISHFLEKMIDALSVPSAAPVGPLHPSDTKALSQRQKARHRSFYWFEFIVLVDTQHLL